MDRYQAQNCWFWVLLQFSEAQITMLLILKLVPFSCLKNHCVAADDQSG